MNARWRVRGAVILALLLCAGLYPAPASGAGSNTPDPILAALSTARWNFLGPSPEGSQPYTNSGQVHAIAADPSNADIVYAGADLGGVWKSADGGSSWTPMTDGLPSASVGAIAVAPSDSTTVYAGFGSQDFERETTGSAAYGAGIWKSTNAGANWTDVSDPAMLGQEMRVIAVDPSDPQHVYAGTSDGLFVSDDGAATWSEVLSGYWTGLVIDPGDPATVYAGGQPNPTSGAVLERSTSFGAPGTWEVLSDGLPSGTDQVNPILAAGSGSPSVFYAEFIDRSTAGMVGLYRSAGGTTWTRLAAAPDAPCYTSDYCIGYGMFSLGVDPSEPSHVLLGGIELYRSTDAGASWSAVCNSDCYLHVDQRGLAFGPAGTGRVYAANDGGVFRSDDGGANWRSVNRGLGITQFYSVAAGPNFARSRLAYGGTQDNGLEHYSGSRRWLTQAPCGDASDALIDPSQPNTAYVACGDVWVTRNNGVDWSDISAGLGSQDSSFAHLVMDPSRPRRIVGGASRLWETLDGGASWRAISGPVEPGSTISALALTPGSSEILAAAGGTLLLTSDDGANWESVSPTTASGYPAAAIAPSDPDTLYVSAGDGFAGTHIYHSADAGASWADVTAGLSSSFVQTIAVDPLDPNLVFVGTWSGPFFSADGGQTWSRLGTGFPNTFVSQFAFDRAHSTLLAATFGRGVYALPLTPSPNWSLWASAARVKPGSSFVLQGTDGPAAAGQRVIVQRLLAGHTSWRTYTSAAADSQGRFSIRVRMRATSVRYRALLPALGRPTPVISNQVRIRVSR